MAIKKRGLVIGATAILISVIAVTGLQMNSSSQRESLSKETKDLVDEVWQIIDRTYVDGTFNQNDWKSVRQEYLNREYVNKEQGYTAIREMLKKLKDPYTRFMDPYHFRDMQMDTSGNSVGVGIYISQDESANKFVISSLFEEHPASRAGILTNDVIAKIDNKPTEGMDINHVNRLIRGGEEGTPITLTIERKGKELEFHLVRAKIKLYPVRFSRKVEGNNNIGYIRLSIFISDASEEMQSAIKELEKQKVDGYILDLRSNSGGLFSSSIEIARMWLDTGTIVCTVNRRGESDRQEANRKALTNKPLVVLVDKGSASASEILAGALQDNQRAILVGTQTYGMGLVQSVRGLKDESGLAVSISKIVIPSGRNFNNVGITPDTVIAITEEQQIALQTDRHKVATSADPYYAKAIQILGVKIVKASDSKNTKIN